jgi:dTMP kinase
MLIALEGIDGCGKTTLASSMDGMTIGRHKITRGGEFLSPLGSQLRANLPRLTPLEKVYWFAADRASTLMHLAKELDSGVIVWDRYVDSARAYRRAEVELGQADRSILSILESVNVAFPVPDLTIFLDVSVHVAMERRKCAFDPRWEHVLSFYLAQCRVNPVQYVKIDGEQSADEIEKLALDAIGTLVAS